ncbi:ArsR family transcriptional regulator [bacterium]|nr:MAG: ArsR family transcriptional regulator [bacterium]
MKSTIEMLKLMTDSHRLRILMILGKKELSVCQLMGILDISQPLVSRNLGLLSRGGFLEERREGKLRFYRIRQDLPDNRKAVINLLNTLMKSDTTYREDLVTLKQCSIFQKKAGRCDMETLKEFMKWKKRRKQ